MPDTPWVSSAASIQDRVLSAPPPLPPTPRDVFKQLKKRLIDASNSGALSNSMHEIMARLKLQRDPEQAAPEAQAIYGGRRNFKRDLGVPHFTRADGAWFDFFVVLAPKTGAVELVTYDFELRFPESAGLGERWVRFDLNPPDHNNQERGLRAHCHPGHDDLMVPAPVLSPMELLDLFIYGMRRPQDRKART